MTWSYINQITQEVIGIHQVVKQKRGRLFFYCGDFIVLVSLESGFSRHRLFASPLAENGVLKDVPAEILALCPTFELSGTQTRASDYTSLCSSRDFLASLWLSNFASYSVGSYRFFVCSLATYRFFNQALFKTRRVTFLQSAFYNLLRACVSIWRPEQLVHAVMERRAPYFHLSMPGVIKGFLTHFVYVLYLLGYCFLLVGIKK